MEDIKGGNIMKHDYSNILDMLKKEFNEVQSENMILTMYDKRSLDLYSSLSTSEEYEKNSNKISEIYEKIKKKYENSKEIIYLFEEYSSAVYCSNYLCEKIMYKHGIMDGMQLIIDGLEKVDAKSAK